MMRNMLDSMTSLRESLCEGPQTIGIYVPTEFQSWEKDAQFIWLARNVSNWYFTFYISWEKACVDTHVIWYEKFYQDQVAGIREILDFTRISETGTVTDEAISTIAANKERGRFKFGKVGRGLTEMPQEAIDIVYSQAASWGPYWESRMVTDLLERG